MIGGGSSNMELESYQTRGDLYFLLRGRVVLEECERLKQACIPLITKGIEQVMVDLSAVDFIDSAGLGVLVGLKMTANKNKARIMLLQPSKPVADILYISKLDGIFDIITGADADVMKSQTAQLQYRVGAGGAPKSGGFESVAPAPPSPSGQAPPASSGSAWTGRRIETAFPDISVAEERPAGGGGGDSDVRSQKEVIEEHCRRAVDYMRQGNYDMSVDEYQRALEIDPEYLPALNNLAIVFEKQPSWLARAIEQWETVLRLSQQRGDQKHIDRAQRHLSSLRRMSS